MALPAKTVWEVRTDGADTNGGGFVTDGTGTDWSQQAAAQYAVTDAVTNGTTTITSATANFGTDVVDNILYIAGGTAPITAGWYWIVSRTNATTIVVDRSTGLSAGTGATLNIGGALLTIVQALTLSTVNAMATYVRGGTYTITTALSPPARAGQYRTRLIGYSTTRGDLGRPIISVTAAVNGLTPAGGWTFENLELDGTSTGVVGVAPTAIDGLLINCHIHHFTGLGISHSAGIRQWSYVRCQINNCAGGLQSATDTIFIEDSYIHSNSASGVVFNSTSCRLMGSIVANNTGASSDGVNCEFGCAIRNNVFYGNGRDGVRAVASYSFTIAGAHIINNVFMNNGGYGINQPSAQTHNDFPWIDYNAFYNNTSGARNNINASPHNVTLTADPFTNAAGNDFSLNNVAGGGAACRNAGFPGALPGLATPLGYADIGVYRHQDGVGASRGFRRGMTN